MSFTGYLLPWDQLAYWAITVGTNIAGYVPVFGAQVRNVLLGGPDVGGAALLRFYVLHIYFMPALIVLLIGIHIWRVRKDGFAVGRSGRGRGRGRRTPSRTEGGDVPMRDREPEPRYRLLGVVPREAEQRAEHEPDDEVFTWPHFLIRHVVVAAGTILVVFALAILFNAPLKDIANPTTTPAGRQGSVVLRRAAGAAVAHPADGGRHPDPGAALLFLVVLPYLDTSIGKRIRDRKMVVIVFTVLAVTALVLTVVGTFFRGPEWSWVWPWQHLYLEL